jgi:hypothetical protein
MELNKHISINAMYINQNNTLLSLATTEGYKIYESYNFLKVSEDSEIHELIGSLKIAIPYYESKILILVGSDENTNLPSSQVVVWDDSAKKKLAVIMFKEKVINVCLSKEGIYIMLPGKIVVFSMKGLKFILAISDVESNKMCISYNINPAVLLHTSAIKQNQLKVTKCKLKLIHSYV